MTEKTEKRATSRLILLTALIAGAASGGCFPYVPGPYPPSTLSPGGTGSPSSPGYSGGSPGISPPPGMSSPGI